MIIPRVELVKSHGPGVSAGAQEPDLALGMVREEVGGGAGGHLGVLGRQETFLVLTLKLGVLPQPVRVVLPTPPGARDVDVVAAALKLLPVLLLVAVDKDGVI